MSSHPSALIQCVDSRLEIVLVESRLSSVRADNEPWKSIEHAIHTDHPEVVCIDLVNVTYMSSEILGKIVGIKRKFSGIVTLTNAAPMLVDVFRVTGLNRILSVTGRP